MFTCLSKAFRHNKNGSFGILAPLLRSTKKYSGRVALFMDLEQSENGSSRIFSILLHTIFFLSGIATVLIGQVLPILSTKFALTDLQAGYLFPAQFTGSIIGTLVTDWFGRKGKLALATSLGSFGMATGLIMMNVDSYAVCLVGFFVNGLGIGLTLPAINILILELNPVRRAAAVSFLNFFWGAGAILSKPFVDVTASPGRIFLPTVLLAIPLILFALVLLIKKKEPEAKFEKSSDPETILTPIWSLPIAWMIALFHFIHVGFESGMGGWLTSYTERIESPAAVGLLSPTLLYFLFFVIGRGIAPLFFRFVDENTMLLLSILIILAGVIVSLSASSIFILSIGACIAGFGTSAVFPTNVSRFSRTFGEGSMRRAMPLFISGTLGATVVTWLIGYVSETTGSLRNGMAVLLAGVVILLVVQIVLSLRKPLT